jgi:ABC-type dipeptide/oligopeptide/nickel transport system ATPase component
MEPDSVQFIPFRVGARVLLVGSSGSGKTRFLSKIISNRKDFFEITPQKVYFYSHSGSRDLQIGQLEQLKNDRSDKLVEFYSANSADMPNDETLFEPYSMLVFDDLLSGADSDKYGEKLLSFFTRRAHHEQLYCFVTAQTLYSPLKHVKLLNQGANYLVLFKSQRSLQQIRYLATTILGLGNSRCLTDMYTAVTKSRPYSYVVLDFHPQTDDRIRHMTNVFEENGEPCIAFQLLD